MKLSKLECSFKDDRGEITDILVKTPMQFVTLITSKKGSRRGGHYHKETTQWVYVLEGKMKLLSQAPDGPVVATTLGKGDLAMNPPLERHQYDALEDTTIMVFTSGVRGGEDYEKDTFRLAEPLREA